MFAMKKLQLIFSYIIYKNVQAFWHLQTKDGPLIPGAWEQSHKIQLKFGLQFAAVQEKCYVVNNRRFVNFGKAT